MQIASSSTDNNRIKIIKVGEEYLAIDLNNPCDIAFAATEMEVLTSLREKQIKYYF